MKNIFVTIGTPNSRIPDANKVAMRVTDGGEIQAAKSLRHEIAREEEVSPSMMSWAIFENVNDSQPVKHSDNWNPETMVVNGIIGTAEKK